MPVVVAPDHVHHDVATGVWCGVTEATDELPVRAEIIAAACAAALAEELALVGPSSPGGWPVFDLVFLGIGGDGHILSVFPGSAAFDSDAWALAIPAPTHIEPHVERVTMHPELVTVAREVLLVAGGTSKADVLADVLGPTREPRRWPAQVARHERATWILDDEAAARLSR